LPAGLVRSAFLRACSATRYPLHARHPVPLEALRAEIQKGFDSGPAEEVDLHEWIEGIKARGRQRLAAQKRGK